MTLNPSIRTLVLLCTFSFLSACGGSLETPTPESDISAPVETPTPVELTAQEKSGEALYQQTDLNCLTCHGNKEVNGISPIDSQKESYQHSSEPTINLTLSDYISQWMPPEAKSTLCTDACADDIAAYIRSWNRITSTPMVTPSPAATHTPSVTFTPDPQVTSEPNNSEQLVRAKAIWAEKGCLTCHGGKDSPESERLFALDSEKLTYSHSNEEAIELSLEDYIIKWMPADPSDCIGQCAQDLAVFLRSWKTSENNPTPDVTPSPSVTSTPATSPSPVATLPPMVIDECNSTPQCRVTYATATDCRDSSSINSICMCGEIACNTLSNPVVTPTPETSPTPVITPTPTVIIGNSVNGEILYNSDTFKCADCHGAEGTSPLPDFFPDIDATKTEIAHSTAIDMPLNLADYIMTYMPTNGGCDVQCAADIAAFIKSWNTVVVDPQPTPTPDVTPTPETTPSPTATPTPVVTMPPMVVDECNTTPQCRMTFGQQATDCKDSSTNKSICMCGAVACNTLDMSTPTPTPTPIVTPTPVVTPTPPAGIVGNINDGRERYNSRTLGCAGCHGAEGISSNPRYPDINANKDVYKHSSTGNQDHTLAHYINRWMPPGATSCDEQCSADIAAYIASWKDNVVVAACEDQGIHYGRRQMRLLTSSEYENSIKDLVGYTFDSKDAGVPADNTVESFSNQVLTPLTQGYMDAYVSIAQKAADYAQSNNFSGIVDCTGLSNSDCGNKFITDFAPRVYRRPLTNDEKTQFNSLFNGSLHEGSNNTALKLAIKTAIGSPNFLYRSEIGEKVADIRDQITNGEADYIAGDTRASLSLDLNADGYREIPLYNNVSRSVNQYTFNNNDIITIVAKGVEADGVLPTMRLKIGGEDIEFIQLTSEQERTYTVRATTISGNNQNVQINNAGNGGSNNTNRKLFIKSISVANAIAVERELPDASLDGDAYVLTPYEMATFLAYTYTGTTPDSTLLNAAGNNELSNDEQIKGQIERLLLTPQARDHFGEFAAQWMRIDAVLSISKDTNLYPGFTNQVRQDMAKESREIFKNVMFNGKQPIKNLYSNFSFMNKNLADFYGVSGPTDNNFVRVNNLTERGGMLTSGAFMAGFAHRDETSPIQRAVAVRERVLCHEIPPMPTNIDDARENVENALDDHIQSMGGKITNRERYKFLTAPSVCADCHDALINPHGFGMEDFDPVGLLRTIGTNGLDIDSSGKLVGTEHSNDGNEIPFNGARQLSNNLRNLDTVNTCFAEKSFRFVMGTGHDVFAPYVEGAPQLTDTEKEGYSCAIESMEQTMNADNNNARTAFMALGMSDIVRYRKQR